MRRYIGNIQAFFTRDGFFSTPVGQLFVGETWGRGLGTSKDAYFDILNHKERDSQYLSEHPGYMVSKGSWIVAANAGGMAMGEGAFIAIADVARIAWAGYAAQKLVTVSRWGRKGLQAGDWVMKGKASRWNYIWSGKWQPNWFPGGNTFTPFKAGESFLVPQTSVARPVGGGIDGWVKALLGQRIYIPK